MCTTVRLRVPIVCITSKRLCIAGPYALLHDLARKNAKFTVKLSATCHAILRRCGELRQSRLFISVNIHVQCMVFASKLPILPVYVHLSYVHVHVHVHTQE